MNFLENKTFRKIYIFLMGLPIVMQGLAFQVARADFTCADVTNAETTKGWIVTILEEQIGSPSTSDVGYAVNCFRVTKTTTDKDGKQQEIVEYKSECESGATFCKKVQVFFSQSGAELLYSYISRIYKWAAGTIGVVAVLFLVWGGIEISTAQGDSGKIEKAKERILQSLGGLVILFLSALILYTINPNFFTAG